MVEEQLLGRLESIGGRVIYSFEASFDGFFCFREVSGSVAYYNNVFGRVIHFIWHHLVGRFLFGLSAVGVLL